MTNKEIHDLIQKTIDQIPRETHEQLFMRSILYSALTALTNNQTKEVAAAMLIVLASMDEMVDGNRGLLN